MVESEPEGRSWIVTTHDIGPQLSIFTSAEVWLPGPFFQRCATDAKRSRLGIAGDQSINNRKATVDKEADEEILRHNLPAKKWQ